MVRAVLGNALDDPGNFRSQFVVFFGVQNCGDLCAGRHFFLIFLLLKVKLDVLIRRPHWQDAEIYLLGERAVPRGIGFDIFGDARILALLSFSAFGANRKIGSAHVCTPVTNAHLVCRLLIETKTTTPKAYTLYTTSSQTVPTTH